MYSVYFKPIACITLTNLDQEIVGTGRPVAEHVAVATLPLETVMSLGDSTISGGTIK